MKKVVHHFKIIGKIGALLFLSVILIGSLSGFNNDLLFRINRGIDLFGRVYREIALHYVDEVDPDKFMKAGIDGMLRSLDPYTVYLGEKDTDEIELVTKGKYAGVGITVGMKDGVITIISPIEGFSAAKQGIQAGDRILEIDGKGVATVSPSELRVLVRGVPGTTLKMKVERDGEPKPLEFVLVREEIPVRNVTYAGFIESGIGYLHLEKFSRTAGDEVRMAIKDLKGKGDLRGLILDLRGNPGGLLEVAVEVAAKFIPESSLVVSTRGRQLESERKYYSAEKPMVQGIPLVVLVDQGTASASEIVAGAIQDLDRGVIVGTRTFGKGLVQTITPLTESSSLKITSGRYFTPSGRSIQEIDYSNDNKGIFSTKPDSLRKEYRTAHNRKVKEAGGILPDSVVMDPPMSKYIRELNRKAMFYKFANAFAAKHQPLKEPFEANDELLASFESFLKEKGFAYEEDSEIKLKEIREIAVKEQYTPSLRNEIESLSMAIEAEKKKKFEMNKNDVRQELRVEILSRMKGEKAGFEAALENDLQVDVAVILLKNKTRYNELLAGK
ncbi:MAG: S41 family peptidase [bacterium]